MLLSMGKEHIYVWEKPPGTLHEDEAAAALARIFQGRGISARGPVEGKIELFAEEPGLFSYDREIVDRINGIEDLLVSARHGGTAVQAGDKLAAVKAVPLVIPEEKLTLAASAAGDGPVMNVLPYTVKTAAVIVTGSEVAAGRVSDAFTPVLEEKLAAYSISVIKKAVTPDGIEAVRAAIAEARRERPGLILCTGGMSVDPDDNTPGAIRQAGAEIVTYGTPVLPGAMFLLGYFDDGVPVMGLPGCVMFTRATIFDMILPRVAAGQRLERRDFSRMGVGGLCLGCPECRYPVCPFCK